jgi:hypothetical protein
MTQPVLKMVEKAHKQPELPSQKVLTKQRGSATAQHPGAAAALQAHYQETALLQLLLLMLLHRQTLAQGPAVPQGLCHLRQTLAHQTLLVHSNRLQGLQLICCPATHQPVAAVAVVAALPNTQVG